MIPASELPVPPPRRVEPSWEFRAFVGGVGRGVWLMIVSVVPWWLVSCAIGWPSRLDPLLVMGVFLVGVTATAAYLFRRSVRRAAYDGRHDRIAGLAVVAVILATFLGWQAHALWRYAAFRRAAAARAVPAAVPPAPTDR